MPENEKSIVRPLEEIEAEIGFYKNQAAIGMIEIGKRLIEAKHQLQHGQWGKWLEEKVNFSQRTANQFMRIATEFPNSQPVSNLGTKKLFLMLDVPAEKRDEFLATYDVENMTTRELATEIKNVKAEQTEIDELDILDIEVNKLKPFPLSGKYFGNITGTDWIAFLNSVQTSGIIDPILISQDYYIISGHQRVRACKDLNIFTVPCRMKKYIDNDKKSKQDAMLCDCLTSNLKLDSDDFEIAADALKEHGWL